MGRINIRAITFLLKSATEFHSDYHRFEQIFRFSADIVFGKLSFCFIEFFSFLFFS